MSKRLGAAIDIRDRIFKLMEDGSEWQSVGALRLFRLAPSPPPRLRRKIPARMRGPGLGCTIRLSARCDRSHRLRNFFL
jgi:hypothetical protein